MSAIVRALKYLFPNAEPNRDYYIRDDGEGPFIKRWHLPQPQPTEAELQAAAAAYDAAETTRQTEAAALKQQIVTLAQSAVGTSVGALTAPQVRALFAIILRKEGALNADGTVKPLAQWVRD